jgi:hypothetical protein
MLHIYHLIFCTGQELLAKNMEEMDIRLFFLAPITLANFASKNTNYEYPPHVVRATNHFYWSSHNPLAMINISIPCVYCPQEMESVALDIIICCPCCKPFFTSPHAIHLAQSAPPAPIFLLVITQPWK